jgi:hypothetical protein
MVLMQPEILERIQFEVAEDRANNRRNQVNGK